eukprot:6579056-Ditylum_brightwellii.AAC.1
MLLPTNQQTHILHKQQIFTASARVCRDHNTRIGREYRGGTYPQFGTQSYSVLYFLLGLGLVFGLGFGL